MNDQNTETVVPTEPKSRFRSRFQRSDTPSDAPSKPKTTIGQKAKNVAAAVGVVTVVGVAAALVTKKKSVKGELTLPDLDVTTQDA